MALARKRMIWPVARALALGAGCAALFPSALAAARSLLITAGAPIITGSVVAAASSRSGGASLLSVTVVAALGCCAAIKSLAERMTLRYVDWARRRQRGKRLDAMAAFFER